MNSKLKKGEIILFKAEKDWLSRTISKLTDSDVSHAVILYSDDSIIEMIADGVCINQVKLCPGKNAYVMRLNPELDAAPVLKAANKYRLSKARYDFPALVILAGTIIMHKSSMRLHLMPICNKIILAAAWQLDLLIQKIILKHPDGDAMVCSQFVYQAFYDCGGDYRLKIKNDTISTDTLDGDGPSCLSHLPIDDYSTSDELLEEGSNVSESPEELAGQLTELLEQENMEMLSEKHYPDILPAVHLFQEKMNQLSEHLHTDLSFESLFVTPADLAYNTTNLKRICSIKIERCF